MILVRVGQKFSKGDTAIDRSTAAEAGPERLSLRYHAAPTAMANAATANAVHMVHLDLVEAAGAAGAITGVCVVTLGEAAIAVATRTCAGP